MLFSSRLVCQRDPQPLQRVHAFSWFGDDERSLFFFSPRVFSPHRVFFFFVPTLFVISFPLSPKRPLRSPISFRLSPARPLMRETSFSCLFARLPLSPARLGRFCFVRSSLLVPRFGFFLELLLSRPVSPFCPSLLFFVARSSCFF